MRNTKTHIRNTRLYVNAGMSIPECQSTHRLLNVESSGWIIVNSDDARKMNVDLLCKTCVRLWNKSACCFSLMIGDKTNA